MDKLGEGMHILSTKRNDKAFDPSGVKKNVKNVFE